MARIDESRAALRARARRPAAERQRQRVGARGSASARTAADRRRGDLTFNDFRADARRGLRGRPVGARLPTLTPPRATSCWPASTRATRCAPRWRRRWCSRYAALQSLDAQVRAVRPARRAGAARKPGGCSAGASTPATSPSSTCASSRPSCSTTKRSCRARPRARRGRTRAGVRARPLAAGAGRRRHAIAQPRRRPLRRQRRARRPAVRPAAAPPRRAGRRGAAARRRRARRCRRAPRTSRASRSPRPGRASTELSNLFDGAVDDLERASRRSRSRSGTAGASARSTTPPSARAHAGRARLPRQRGHRLQGSARCARRPQRGADHAATARAARAQALERAAELTRLRFDGGESSRLDVIEAERAALTAQAQNADARRALTAAQADVFRALGGGWKAPEAKGE